MRGIELLDLFHQKSQENTQIHKYTLERKGGEVKFILVMISEVRSFIIMAMLFTPPSIFWTRALQVHAGNA